MEKVLYQCVIGQEEVIVVFFKIICCQCVGFKDLKCFFGLFIFVGFMGVGKIELVKVFVEFLFDDEVVLIFFDMSEFGEKYIVLCLFGVFFGFVGFEEGGQFIEKVWCKLFSVVFFDEIEKVYLDIFNLLLQIFEEGCFIDGQGWIVDFKNMVIIMIINFGVCDIVGGLVGFQIEGNNFMSYEWMKGKVNEELKWYFKFEFFNCVDDIIVFLQLSKEELVQIVDLFIKCFGECLLDCDMMIELLQVVKECFIEIGFDLVFGVCLLCCVMQYEVEDCLLEKILYGEFNLGDYVKVDVENGEFLFEYGLCGEKVVVGVNIGGGVIVGIFDLVVVSGE